MKENRRGIDFVEALQLIFITLRLCNVIEWNWIWVLSPFWGALLLAIVSALLTSIKTSKRRYAIGSEISSAIRKENGKNEENSQEN